MVSIGVNKGSSDAAKAELIGKTYNPFKHIKKGGGALAAVIIVLLCLFSVATAFFLKARKEQSDVNRSVETKKKQTYNIQNEDLDESLKEPEALDEA